MSERQSTLATLLSEASSSATPTNVLLPMVYDELREMARRQLAHERYALTLQTTALVHEAYVRLGADPSAQWESKRHYYHAAAIAMRRILIEAARARLAAKRGGGSRGVPIDEAEIAGSLKGGDEASDVDWLALDEALTALEGRDPELAHLVQLRYFAGLSVDQVAAARGVSSRTIDREWRVARAFLRSHLDERGDVGGKAP